MDIIIKILAFVFSLTILVTIHEFGHYITAKIFGARVDKFYIFFNPYFSLFKKKIGETEYGLGWLPLGGYCKIAGMVDESMDTEALKQAPQSWEYRSKPAWQRLIIIVGGVVMNVILAWFIYSMVIFSKGETYIAARDVKDGIMIIDSTLTTPIGLKNGDIIKEVNGREIEKFFDVYNELLMGESVTVSRNGRDTTLSIPVDYIDHFSQDTDPFFLYPRVPLMVASIPDSSINASSGLIEGDVILSVSGTPTPYYDMAAPILMSYAGRDVMLEVERDGAAVFIGAQVSQDGKLGIYPLPTPAMLMEKEIFPVTAKEYGFFSSLVRGASITGNKIAGYWEQVKKIVNPQTKAYKKVGSVITMGSMFPSSWDWLTIWQLTAFLSIMLAVVNILPIPALDGGHAVFIIYEMITRRPPSEKVLEYAQMAGFVILMIIMILAFGNDILRLFA
ncbi:MAG: RIP metalloprotease RseP [Flavobacteriales bacterium]|nr:RIP metalloprotease RseP [Flavobacteriales bacterium]MBQ8650584.1 RIP metalloprotease RseP [Flavobacteriales bacterium]